MQIARLSHKTPFIFLNKESRPKTVFWVSTPCSQIIIYRRFGGTSCLHLQSKPMKQLGSSKQCTAYSLTLKREAVCSSETLMKFYQRTWRHITEGSVLLSRHTSPLSEPQSLQDMVYSSSGQYSNSYPHSDVTTNAPNSYSDAHGFESPL
jgi:hypothetical protein